MTCRVAGFLSWTLASWVVGCSFAVSPRTSNPMLAEDLLVNSTSAVYQMLRVYWILNRPEGAAPTNRANRGLGQCCSGVG